MKILNCRKRELETLNKVYQSNKAEFIAIYGRRRIGKTFLIHEYFQDKGIYLELTGIYKAPLAQQLKNFTQVYQDVFRSTAQENISSWFDAFDSLRQAAAQIPKDQKIILFFDELPWLASPRSNFLAALEHCWNRYLSRMSNVIVVVCGSAASWMLEHIVNNRGGLHGRLSQQIELLPFSLAETAEFLQANQVQLSAKDLITLYMAIGGVAKYLTLVKPGMSVTQIIQALCFTHNGYLQKEFERLYASLFNQHDNHVRLVRQLAKSRQGLTREDLLAQANLSTGGSSTKFLQELEASGFIVKLPLLGQKKKRVVYRLQDEYSLFYLQWIEPQPIPAFGQLDPDHWFKQQASRQYSTWAGLAFEDLCLKHIRSIQKTLGLSGISIMASSWQSQEAQIDLVIERADGCVNLCEIKFCQGEFVIDKAYAEKLEQKKYIYQQQTKSKKTLFTTLITPYGVKENQYYFQSVQNQITMQALFE